MVINVKVHSQKNTSSFRVLFVGFKEKERYMFYTTFNTILWKAKMLLKSKYAQTVKDCLNNTFQHC